MIDFFHSQKKLLLAALLFFAQFFILDIYYYDDLFRAQSGYYGWIGDGRALGELFYKALSSFRSALADIYPIPLIVATILFSYLLHSSLKGFGIFNSNYQIIILLVVISSPLTLSNWLFRYDSAFMLLSVGFAAFPFYFYNKKKISFWIASSISIICVLTTYQISLNIFIGLTGIYAFILALQDRSNKQIILFVMYSAISVLISYLIYSKVIIKVFPTHNYAQNFTKIPSYRDLSSIIINNIFKTIEVIKPLLKSGLLTPMLISVVFSIVAIIITKNQKLKILIWYLIAFLTTIFSISGVMLISETAPFYTRTFLGIIPFTIFPLIIMGYLRTKKLFYISAIILLICQLTIDRAIINAVAAENKRHDSLSQQIFTELSLQKISYENILIVGSPTTYSNVFNTNKRNFPIIDLIIPKVFSGSYAGGRFMLMKNSFQYIEYPNQETTNKIQDKIEGSIPIASNYIYELYVIDNIPIIKFR